MGFKGGYENNRRMPETNPSRNAGVAATGGGNIRIVARIKTVTN
jgi:hypothetical protein